MRLTQVTAVVLLVAYVPACTSYQALVDPVEGLRAPAKPIERARITLVSGERFELEKPVILGDSLSGTRKDVGSVSVGLSDIMKAEVRRPDTDKTVGLVVGIVVLAGVAALLVTNAVVSGYRGL